MAGESELKKRKATTSFISALIMLSFIVAFGAGSVFTPLLFPLLLASAAGAVGLACAVAAANAVFKRDDMFARKASSAWGYASIPTGIGLAISGAVIGTCLLPGIGTVLGMGLGTIIGAVTGFFASFFVSGITAKLAERDYNDGLLGTDAGIRGTHARVNGLAGVSVSHGSNIATRVPLNGVVSIEVAGTPQACLKTVYPSSESSGDFRP